MVYHFHICRGVKTIRYIIYAKTMHGKWKQTPNRIWFLRRCDSTLSNGNKGLENEMFQRTAKFIMSDFYGMDLVKGIAILVKVNDLCNSLKSLLATAYW